MRYRLILVWLALMVAAPAAAQNGPSVRWERYDNVADIGADARVRIAEQQRIVVEQGPLRRITRTFELAGASVTEIEVLESGRAYRRDTSQVPGTFSATSDGTSVSIQAFFRDPNALAHDLELRYTLQNAVVAPNTTDALLDWRFFWAGNAPPIDAGSIQINLPAAVAATDLQFNAEGASGQQTTTGNGVRWELTAPIQGQQVQTQTTFPQTALNPGIALPPPNTTTNTAPVAPAPDNTTTRVPNAPSPSVAVPVSGFASMITCVISLVVMFVVFSMLRALVGGRTIVRPMRGPTIPPIIDPDPFGMGGMGRRRRRRGGMRGGFFPPIFIPPPSPPRGNNTPWGGSPFDNSSGGGGSSWGDSGGGGSSWGDSSGGGSSWGGGSGGGGSSWGGGGGSSGGSGGGGGGSGGGSFG